MNGGEALLRFLSILGFVFKIKKIIKIWKEKVMADTMIIRNAGTITEALSNTTAPARIQTSAGPLILSAAVLTMMAADSVRWQRFEHNDPAFLRELANAGVRFGDMANVRHAVLTEDLSNIRYQNIQNLTRSNAGEEYMALLRGPQSTQVTQATEVETIAIGGTTANGTVSAIAANQGVDEISMDLGGRIAGAAVSDLASMAKDKDVD